MRIQLRDEHMYTLGFADDQIAMVQYYNDLDYIARKPVNVKKGQISEHRGRRQKYILLADGQQIRDVRR